VFNLNSYLNIASFIFPVVFNTQIQCTVCYCLTEFISFDGRAVFTLVPKVQVHVSALDHRHFQVVHESLQSSYTRFNMDCYCGVEVDTRFGTCHGVWVGGGLQGVTAIIYMI